MKYVNQKEENVYSIYSLKVSFQVRKTLKNKNNIQTILLHVGFEIF